MPSVVITHKVADVETWLSFSPERVAAIGNLGGTNVVDHVAVDSDEVAITCEIEDVDAVLAILQSPPAELVSVMEKHRVIQPLTVFVAR
jgi:hypothetical protein